MMSNVLFALSTRSTKTLCWLIAGHAAFPDFGVKAFGPKQKHSARDDASSHVRRERCYAADRAEEGGDPKFFVAVRS
jgi:hypothetical protein